MTSLRTVVLPRGRRREVLDEVLEQVVGQPVLVGPLAVAEDAVQVLLVLLLDAAHGAGDGASDVGRGLADVAPVAALRHLEAVLVGKVVAVGLDHLGALLVPHVADALEEEQGQDVALPVGAIDRAAAQDVRGLPEVGLELVQGQLLAICHRVAPRADSVDVVSGGVVSLITYSKGRFLGNVSTLARKLSREAAVLLLLGEPGAEDQLRLFGRLIEEALRPLVDAPVAIDLDPAVRGAPVVTLGEDHR